MVVNAGEIGMSETGQYERFAFEGTGYLGKLLWGQTSLAHLFHGDQLTGGSGILGLIHRAKATFAYHTDDAIALPEQAVVGKLPGGRFDGMVHLRSSFLRPLFIRFLDRLLIHFFPVGLTAGKYTTSSGKNKAGQGDAAKLPKAVDVVRHRYRPMPV